MMEPATSVSRCDIAAFIALLNMLKINLSMSQKPEIYRALLAVLVDYNPEQSGNKERVWLLTPCTDPEGRTGSDPPPEKSQKYRTS